MAILVKNSMVFPGCVDDVVKHPDGSEEDENDEEDLQVGGANGHIVVGTPAGQSTAQDQNVHRNDPRQHPAPVSAVLPHNPAGGEGKAGLTMNALHLTHRLDVVGQVGLLRLPVFCRHPTWFTRVSGGQTIAWISSVQTHDAPH